MVYPVDAGDDSGEDQPLNGVFKLRGPPAFLHQLVLEAGVLFGELNRDVIVDQPGLLGLILLVIFTHIIEIGGQKGVLNMPDQNIVAGFDELADAVGDSPPQPGRPPR